MDLVNNFHRIINFIKQLYNFIDLEKYYYKSELSYNSILRLYQLCMINDDVTSIHNKLKSNNEKQLLLIIDLLSKNYLENKFLNVEVIIANDNNLPLPVGFSGEILLGGDSIINEYIYSSEQTSTKFITTIYT
mgnify:CR=1 FL=1